MNFFFDNTMSPRLARAINALVEPEGHSVQALRELFPTDAFDETWIPKLSSFEGEWVVVTHDRAITRRPHERAALEATDLRICFLSSAWANHDGLGQAWRLIKYWDKIVQNVSKANRGTSFLLQLNGNVTRNFRT